MAAVRRRLTFANVMSVIAVFIALGGSAIAINKIKANSVGSKQLKTGAVRTDDLADNSVTSPKVANGSLQSEDFGAGQLPRGATGPQGVPGQTGATGPQGVQGQTGTVDTSNFYDKAASDARFLGIVATANNSNSLGGVGSGNYPRTVIGNNIGPLGGQPRFGFGRVSLAAGAGTTTVLFVGLLGEITASCADPARPTIQYHNVTAFSQDVETQDMITGNFGPVESVAAGASTTPVLGSAVAGGIARFDYIVGSGFTNANPVRLGVLDVTAVTAPPGNSGCVLQVNSSSYTHS